MPPPASIPRDAGRHRRVPPPTRGVLFGLLVVLTVLLGSGTALVKLTSMPVAEPPVDGIAAIGVAPDPTPTQLPSSSPSPSPTPTKRADEAEETTKEPRPAESPAEDRSRRASRDEVDRFTSLENEVISLTNAERSAVGCGEVRSDERLRTAARAHSQDMADHDYFSHTGLDGGSFVDRVERAGFPSSQAAGENIAMGYRTPADVMQGWMNSDGHRRNILTCSHQWIGVGLAYDQHGRPYWTQVFGR